MTVKARILSIRIIQKIQDKPAFASALGLSLPVWKTREHEEECNNV